VPTGRGVRIVLLVEDEAMECFVRRVLKGLGNQTRIVRVERSPQGKGSAKTWVTKNYIKEVRAHRSKVRHQANIGLVVGTDADNLTARERREELDAALAVAGFPRRQSEEKICLIIPKWNIETWLVHLDGFEVDENSDDYKNHRSIKNIDYGMLAEKFIERYRSWKQGIVAETMPPSMILAFEELKRFDF
jgi:hypothetical protein